MTWASVLDAPGDLLQAWECLGILLEELHELCRREIWVSSLCLCNLGLDQQKKVEV